MSGLGVRFCVVEKRLSVREEEVDPERWATIAGNDSCPGPRPELKFSNVLDFRPTQLGPAPPGIENSKCVVSRLDPRKQSLRKAGDSTDRDRD